MSISHKDKPQIIVALDFPDAPAALEFSARVQPTQCRLKIGLELYTASGPRLIEQLSKKGFDIFLDLKYHDIPNTVAKACAAAAQLGVWMINVHATGGQRMLVAAREALEGHAHRPHLIAVTLLTSQGPADLTDVGLNVTPLNQVVRLAALAADAGLDGVVCSAQEARYLRQAHGNNFLLVTPGIRPVGSSADDQQRIVTPHEAISAGADFLVIGRPITRAQDPQTVLNAIQSEIYTK